MEQAVIFAFGGICYSAMEILWRGHTHWTMALAGGVCAMIIYVFLAEHPYTPMFHKCLFGAFVITSVELVTGVIVNIILKWQVWDYSSLPLNLWGQICLPYTLLWFFLCIPVVKLFEYFHSLA